MRLWLLPAVAVTALGVRPAPGEAQAGRAAIVRLAQASGGPLWMATPGALVEVAPPRVAESLCAGRFGPGPLAPVLASSPDGTLYLARFDGLYVVRAGTVVRVPAFAGRWATDVVVRPDDPHAALATVATTGGTDNGLYVTPDDGRSFARAPLSNPVEYYESVRVAPSQPAVIYVTGYGPGPGGRLSGALWASADGGRTFAGRPLVDPAAPGASDAKLLAVNPVAPRELYLRFDQPVTGHAVYLASRDGGATLREMLVRPWEDGPDGVPQPLVALDATTLVVATRAGLLVSHDDGASFAFDEALRRPLTAVLAAGGRRLYLGGDVPAVALVDLAAGGKTLATLAAGSPLCDPPGRP